MVVGINFAPPIPIPNQLSTKPMVAVVKYNQVHTHPRGPFTRRPVIRRKRISHVIPPAMAMNDLATFQLGDVCPTRVRVPSSCIAAEMKNAKNGAARERYFLGTNRVGAVNACYRSPSCIISTRKNDKCHRPYSTHPENLVPPLPPKVQQASRSPWLVHQSRKLLGRDLEECHSTKSNRMPSQTKCCTHSQQRKKDQRSSIVRIEFTRNHEP
jgi:hypothetical protein